MLISIQFLNSLTRYQTKNKEPNLLYYLLRAESKTDGFMPFSMTFEQNETQTASSRFWSRVSHSVSNAYEYVFV